MYFKTAALVTLVSSVLAQRPSDTSICDYYTTALLKDNTPANQYTLLTLLVNTVVIGNYTQPNTGVSVPGILAPGSYGGEMVNLLPYFNGCLKSSNRGGMPASVNFLDGGGAAPIMKNMPANDQSSNQYRLLTHLYQFFGKLLGCSGYGQSGFPSYQGNPGMYQVHRFMGLNENELGYFIQQVGLAALSFGVTQDDATSVGSALMMLFGYRCSPPTAVIGGPMLQSMCTEKTCPLDPNAQCGSYPYYGVSPEPENVCSSSYTKEYTSTKYEHYTTSQYGKEYTTTYEKYYTSTEPWKEYTTSEYKKNKDYTTEPWKEYSTTKEHEKEYTTTKKYEKEYTTTEPWKEYTTSSEYKKNKDYTTESKKKEEYTTSEYKNKDETTKTEEYEHKTTEAPYAAWGRYRA